MSIKDRVAKLEQRNGSAVLPDALIYCIVKPGRIDDGYDRVTGEAGQEWRRRGDETSDALLDRVSGEAKRPGTLVTLIAHQPEKAGEKQA